MKIVEKNTLINYHVLHYTRQARSRRLSYNEMKTLFNSVQ